MKAKFLKIAGVKSEKEFYKKYPTEAAFFKAHPEAKELKKAAMGSYIGGDLDVNAPIQSYQQYANLVPTRITGQTQKQIKEEQDKQAAEQSTQQGGVGMGDFLKSIGAGFEDMEGLSTMGLGTTKGSDALGLKKGAMSGAPKMATKVSSLPGIGKKGKKVKKAQTGATAGILSGASGKKPDVMGGIAQGLPLIGDVATAIRDLNEIKQQRKELERSAGVSDVALKASQTQPERTARRYVRPEDAIVSPNEAFIPGGTGTEILAEYGASIGGNPTEIQNMYNPGDLYSNLGYEPLSESDVVKQYYTGGAIPKAKGGMDFANFMSGGGGQAASSLIGAGFSNIGGGAAAGSQIGGAVGKAAGMFFGPIGSAIAGPAGQLLGGAIGAMVDAPGAKKQARNEQKLKSNMQTMAMQDSVRGALGNYSSFVKNGGDIPYAEYGWVSNDWQPQVIAKWGDVNVEDVDDIFRPADMRTLEHGGPVKAQGGYNLPYANYEERVNRFRDIMGKYSEEELNRKATTQAGLAEYAKLYPNEPFTQEDISFFQDYTTKVLDPQTQAFMQRRGKEWTPGTQRSKTDAIWGPKTQKQPFATAAIKPAGASEFTDLGTVRGGYATSGTGSGASSDMTGLIPGRINVGGKPVKIDVVEGKGYFKNPITGDTTVYDPSRYASETGKYGGMRTGGSIRQNYLSELDNFNFGGSLKTHWGGRAEVDSYNPYLPGTGETVMFKGNQHSESDGKGNTGIGVSYGESDSYTDYAEYGTEQAVKKAKVEVENREPAIQLPEPSPYSPMQNFASGGQANNNNYSMTVFGALKINEHAANEIGDKQAKGRTFKTYIAEVNKKENEANNKLAKANEQLENLKVVTPFDRLKLNSLQSTIQGENDKLKDYAVKKVTAAEVQNAYNETAEEYGIDADALAKGKIKPSKDMNNAKYGVKKAQRGVQEIPKMSNFLRGLGLSLPENVANIQPRLDSLVTSAGVFPTRPKYNPFAKPESEYTESAGSDVSKSTNSSIPKSSSSNTSTNKATSTPKTANRANSSTDGGKYEGIVDYLKRTGKSSDFKSRKKLAEERGIKNYKGTANQNNQLLNILKNDKGVSAVETPSGTTTVDSQTSSTYSPMSKFLSGDIPKINFKSSTPLSELKETSSAAEKKKGKTDWMDFAKIASTQLANLLRRPLQEPLSGDQLYGEMLAKAQNQLQPVQAQKYQPLLDTPFDVSFQDRLNQNQATLNAFLKQPGVANNPAAMQALAAQKYQADSQVLADQFRTNQAMRAGVFSKNRETLNDAALKNLAILDQQYTRQAEALSKTKATDLEIAKSISDKIAKNRLENRTFAAYSNMFPQYGFTRDMRAISQAPTFFGTGMVPGLTPEDAKSWQEWFDEKEKKKKEASTTAKYGKNLKKHFKNGSIVKSLKNI